MLNVIMLISILLNVIAVISLMLSVLMLIAIILSVIMLSALMLSVIMLSAIMYSVVVLSAIILSVIMLSVECRFVACPGTKRFQVVQVFTECTLRITALNIITISTYGQLWHFPKNFITVILFHSMSHFVHCLCLNIVLPNVVI